MTPSGEVWYASLAGNHAPRVDAGSRWATVVQLPTPGQGAPRVWSGSRDRVWPSDFGANPLVVFELDGEAFRSFPLPSSPSNVRQILGRPEEVRGAESAADLLVVVRGA